MDLSNNTEAEALIPEETGDVFDEDTGEFLGSIDLNIQGKPVLPAQIAIFYEGYFYIFKPQSKYKSEEEKEENKE